MTFPDLLAEVDELGCKLTFLRIKTGWKVVATYDERISVGTGKTPADALDACLMRIHQGQAA